jgi:lipoyl synthase
VNTAWRPRLPDHLKRPVPSGAAFFGVRGALAGSGLATVCEEALCPNRTECWARGTLTFQILGRVCTRRCGFCGETTGRPSPPDGTEPRRLAEAAVRLGLKHVVVTSPARDDMPDQGAGQFAACLRELRARAPGVTVEVLTPDFQGRADLLEMVFLMKPDVFNHNIETVRRLTPRVRGRATYDRSLAVLSKAAAAGLRAKSGLMVGLGETREELSRAFRDLREAGVTFVTVGQYLPPSAEHLPVERFYSPEEFAALRREAGALFERAQVGPLVRSSYHAAPFDDPAPSGGRGRPDIQTVKPDGTEEFA